MKAAARDLGMASLAMGQQAKAGGQDLLGELGAVAAAIKRLGLRNILTSGARSNPRTRPEFLGEYSLRPSGRLMLRSATSRSVSELVRSR